MARRYWLVKSEPDVFSFDDLWKAKGRTTSWDGVRNYQARNLLRDEMKVGDRVLFYHSSTDPQVIAGICEVVKEGHPDVTQFDAKHDHYDADSSKDAPRWFVVDLKAIEPLARPVSLAEIKAAKGFEGLMLIKKGSRLSVQPVSDDHYRRILELSKRDPK
jgi:predicted RNA-binding protein with PUA-like domain